MPLSSRQDYVIIDLIQQAVRNIKAQPLNLGGFGGPGGGTGTPPGGFIGRLPQYEVAYDETEAATLDTLPSGLTGASGWSLVDNLNHIRYRIQTLESGGSIIVEDWDGNPSVNPTNRIIFSGAIVTDLGDGDVLVAVGSGGGGGSPLTVEELDGSPSVSSVDKIKFNGAIVTDLGGGDAQVDAAPQYTWFRFNPSDETLEFGADVGGKEVNSGKIGYESFGAGYLHVVGAGEAPDRWVRLHDKVESNLFKGGFQINSMTNASVLGTDSSGNIVDNTTGADDRYAPFDSWFTGWVVRSETWTRTGNHTFTLSGDFTNVYRKYAKVRYRDGGSDEYGVILSSTHSSGTTTVELIPNSDYAMAAATITDKYISYADIPSGLPSFFNYSPSYSASGSMTYTSVSTAEAKWYVNGSTLFYMIQASGTTGGTASNTILITPPVTIAGSSSSYPNSAAIVDGTSAATVGTGAARVSDNKIFVRKSDNSSLGLGTGRLVQAHGFYQF